MNQIEVRSTTKEKIDQDEIIKVLADALKIFQKKSSFVEVSFVGAKEMQRLNSEYRGKNQPTDVLSFPQIKVPKSGVEILGDIVVCLEIVSKKNETLTDVLKHGLLHLLGFDHESNEPEWVKAAGKINCAL